MPLCENSIENMGGKGSLSSQREGLKPGPEPSCGRGDGRQMADQRYREDGPSDFRARARGKSEGPDSLCCLTPRQRGYSTYSRRPHNMQTRPAACTYLDRRSRLFMFVGSMVESANKNPRSGKTEGCCL